MDTKNQDIAKSFHLGLPSVEEIITDKEALQAKEKTMRGMRWHSIFQSISQVTTFIGGPLMAAGLTGAAVALGNAGLFSSTFTGLSLTAIGGATTLGLLGAGALFVVAAVASSYIASRIWQASIFNSQEIASRSTAKHLVQEIESHNMCLAENKARADGKSWCEVAAASKAAAEARVRA